MKKLYFWSDTNGGLEFPISSSSPELISDDFGDTSLISSVRSSDAVNIKVEATSNITYVRNDKWAEKFLVNLITNNIKSLVKMSTKFKVFIDFAIYDEKKNIIEEGVKIHPLDDVKDTVRIFDVDENDQCNYIQEKCFKTSILLFGPAISACGVNYRGILLTKKSPKFLRIRRIMIGAQLEDSSSPKGIAHLNRTIIDKTIHCVSPTTDDVKENFVMIYDSAGQPFSIVNFGDSPRSISLDLNISVSGFFQASKATQAKIDETLSINAGENPDNPITPPDNPDDPEEGGEFFSQFERCESTNPKAGKVISDIEYEEGNYEGRCYPYSKVVLDIADITIGEYVEFVESLSFLSI